VTHELRTPLSVVRVYVDLLGEAGAPRTPMPTPWRTARRRPARRLDRLVDSILASVRGEGLTGLSRAPFDAVRRSTRRSRRSAAAPPAPDPLGAARRPMTAIGDETRFRQVLEQLLENESKYAPTEKGVSIGIWRQGDEVQVYVTDDGPGVPVRGVGERLRAVRPRGRPGTVARVRHRAVRRSAAHGSDGRPRVPRAERVRRLALRGRPAAG
jgi:signal transduction histidine kinase